MTIPRWGLTFIFVCFFFIFASIFLALFVGRQEELAQYGVVTTTVGERGVWFEATRQGVFSHEGSVVRFESHKGKQEVVLKELLPEGSTVQVMYRLARPYEAEHYDPVDFWFWSACSGATSGVLLLLALFWGVRSVQAAYRSREQ